MKGMMCRNKIKKGADKYGHNYTIYGGRQYEEELTNKQHHDHMTRLDKLVDFMGSQT